MGFHGFLQSQNVPFEGVIAKVWNKRMFKQIREQADAASHLLAEEKRRLSRTPPITESWSASRTSWRSRPRRRFP